MITTTIVRIAVARLDPTPSIPTFASIDVSAAKNAEPSANQNHIAIPPTNPNLHQSFFLGRLINKYILRPSDILYIKNSFP